MNAPTVTPATIRGRAALIEVYQLFELLQQIDGDIHDLHAKGKVTDWPYGLSVEEMQVVMMARRDAVLNKLENKGIRVAPDPSPFYDTPSNEAD